MTEPVRWLDAEQQRTWRAFLWATRRVNEDLDRQLQQDAGMPHAYYMILVRLCEAPERRCTMTELARQTGFSASRLSHAVNRLEALGWVRRRKDPHCGRTTLAAMTEAGYDALVSAAPGHVAQVRRSVFDRLSAEEQRQLLGICRRLLEDGPEETGCPG
ncbi:DNA-binding MarR family transcriptional regulator [Stackebrandtia albiflava]|uniref:DNA-binding MarR family transcriptional regulator n=1 Tax=Stackebrandtia albiflava TaxID=406432 RepID=A0A562V562_9ACTN|nr:MarR family winged helix-turn-helix transcriptional regulator [Stackebrandtia albiflava]TWJ12947.1 DNA-binding MarR family transcriptional regulator [Stackebrandtia albiflava]